MDNEFDLQELTLGAFDLERPMNGVLPSVRIARKRFLRLLPRVSPQTVNELLGSFPDDCASELPDSTDSIGPELTMEFYSQLARKNDPFSPSVQALLTLIGEKKSEFYLLAEAAVNFSETFGNIEKRLEIVLEGRFEKQAEKSNLPTWFHASRVGDFFEAWVTTLFIDGEGQPVRGNPCSDHLIAWARRWNLGEDKWILEFSARALSEFVSRFLNKRWMSNFRHPESEAPMRIEELSGRQLGAWYGQILSGVPDYLRKPDVSDLPAPKQFVFTWPITQSSSIKIEGVYHPFTNSKKNFIYNMDGNLWSSVTRYWEENRDHFLGKTRQAAQTLKRFDDELSKYIKENLSRFRRFGLPPPKKVHGDIHFCWFIEYQLNGKTYEEIAERANQSYVAVREAVTKIGNLIGIPLEKRPRGKRPKSRKS